MACLGGRSAASSMRCATSAAGSRPSGGSTSRKERGAAPAGLSHALSRHQRGKAPGSTYPVRFSSYGRDQLARWRLQQHRTNALKFSAPLQRKGHRPDGRPAKAVRPYRAAISGPTLRMGTFIA